LDFYVGLILWSISGVFTVVFQCSLKMFTNSDSRKQFRDSKVYNLRPLPIDGTHRRNPDEDFMLNGFGSNIK
jgi:hypothetical protein